MASSSVPSASCRYCVPDRAVVQSFLKYSDGSKKDVIRPLLEVFQPRTYSEVELGTSKGGSATCPITGYTTSVEGVRSQLVVRRGVASDARLVAVVVGSSGESGRTYRLVEQADEEAFAQARDRFEQQLRNLCTAGDHADRNASGIDDYAQLHTF